MVDVPQIVYHNSNGVTINLFTKNVVINWLYPGKEVVRQVDKVGIVVDPNMIYRQVTCTAPLTGDQVNTLNGYLMPASAPDYSGAYPKIEVKLDGDTTLTIEVANTATQAVHQVDNKWLVAFTFTEKTD